MGTEPVLLEHAARSYGPRDGAAFILSGRAHRTVAGMFGKRNTQTGSTIAKVPQR
jgi:hypothetical protein